MKPISGRHRQDTDIITPIHEDEVICSGSDEEYYDSPTQRRRRYEVQAQRFLEGRSLTILSAQLRGPFTKESGWQNPWLGKSRGEKRVKVGGTQPGSRRSPVSLPNTTLVNVPDSPSKTVARKFGPRHISLGSLKTSHWAQVNACHLPSPVSSTSYGAAINPYMDDTAWSRVQAWVDDVVTTIGSDEDSMAVVHTPMPTPRQNKRPASSQLLRNAFAKKMRSTGLDQSKREQSQNHSNLAPQSPGSSNAVLGSDIQSLPKSHANLSSFTEAAVNGFVAEQTDISPTPRKDTLPSRNTMVNNGSAIHQNVGSGGLTGRHIQTTPTPTREPRLLVTGPRSNPSHKVFTPERSPLRPNGTKINVILNRGALQSVKNSGQVMGVAPGLKPSVDAIESPEESLDFCSQADRSFHYHSKAPKASVGGLRIESTRHDLEPSVCRESASEDPEVQAPEIRPQSFEETQSSERLAMQDKGSREDRSGSNKPTKGTGTISEEVATPGYDGPTLIPTSSAPDQQVLLQSTDNFGQDGLLRAVEGCSPRKKSQNRDRALPEFNCASKPNASSGEMPPISLQERRVDVESARIMVRPKNLDDATQSGRDDSEDGGASGSVLGQKANDGSGGNPHRTPEPQPSAEQSPIRDLPHHNPYGPQSSPNSVSSPLQQSPWTKETPIITGTVANTMRFGSLTDFKNRIFPEPVSTAMSQSPNPWRSEGRPGETISSIPLSIITSPQRGRSNGEVMSPSPLTSRPLSADAESVSDTRREQTLPSTPTAKHSSLPNQDLTAPAKSFRDFMSPSPEPRCRSNLASPPGIGKDKAQRPKSALSRGHRHRAKKAHLRVSFVLPDEHDSRSSVMDMDLDETMADAELRARGATSPSLIRRALTQTHPRRAISPPPELSHSELPAESTRFGKHFHAQARTRPQMKRPVSYKPLLPTAFQQTCSSPNVNAMAEAFIEADRAYGDEDVLMTDPQEEKGEDEEDAMDVDNQFSQAEEVDDVSAVVQNLDYFLKSFDLDTELDKARRDENRQGEPQEMSVYFPSTQDQMKIMGAGVWDYTVGLDALE